MSDRRRLRAGVRVAVAILFLAYAVVLFHHTVFAVGGSDSSGYLNAARLFSQGRVTERIRGLERLSLGPDFSESLHPARLLARTPARHDGSQLSPRPALQMAAAGLVGGWSRAPFLVSPIAALACLVLMYLLGRELGLPPLLAVAGSALLGFAPVFVFRRCSR